MLSWLSEMGTCGSSFQTRSRSSELWHTRFWQSARMLHRILPKVEQGRNTYIDPEDSAEWRMLVGEVTDVAGASGPELSISTMLHFVMFRVHIPSDSDV